MVVVAGGFCGPLNEANIDPANPDPARENCFFDGEGSSCFIGLPPNIRLAEPDGVFGVPNSVFGSTLASLGAAG